MMGKSICPVVVFPIVLSCDIYILFSLNKLLSPLGTTVVDCSLYIHGVASSRPDLVHKFVCNRTPDSFTMVKSDLINTAFPGTD